MAAESKVAAQQIEETALETDSGWSPVHMMMFCTLTSAFMWAGIIALFRWVFG